MLKKFSILNKVLNYSMATCMALIAILVFMNVILRYFNLGITWAEEISQFLFVWLVFLGAVIALVDNQHLRIDFLTKRLPTNLRRGVAILVNLIILYILWIILAGSWKLTILNMNMRAPVSGLPYSYLYGVGIVMSLGMAIVIIMNIYKAIFQKDSFS
ncbi:TRAP transporter small permease [Halalkalibacter alkaliphilus]|uniref:TRAP transporter small permease n=1 Tax=Halalkalibacter alkaliphilus TaxID=2917993 RepID=A0A9X2I9L4_9BACI|nr:TRAP transporter small permease [Halalkalibacter alkaliphilus]MCL7749514.1 TRAP transporter small permease [Halalkalibacter alkaliphilus]